MISTTTKRPSNSWGVFFLFLMCSGAALGADAPSFDSLSTAAAPCGVGVPPPGHSVPDVWASLEGLSLTVRQDRDRLCYTLNGRADAPTIRVRLGSDLIITLRNEITDIGAIDAVTGPGKLTVATDRVPASPGFFPVVPGMKHHATGATNLHVHGFAVPPVKPQDDVLTVCTETVPSARYQIPSDTRTSVNSSSEPPT